MYIPKSFSNENLDEIIDFVKHHSFGVLISNVEGIPYATHVPFMIERKSDNEIILYSHFAKANEHAKHIQNVEALIIFTGPHAYVSNKWYEEHNTVSTWNYVAVHMYGQVQLVEDQQNLYQLLKRTTETYGTYFNEEPMENNDAKYIDNMMKGIIGFEIKVTKVEGKWKLSQNHSEKRREKVIKQLEKLNDENSYDIAQHMKKYMDK